MFNKDLAMPTESQFIEIQMDEVPAVARAIAEDWLNFKSRDKTLSEMLAYRLLSIYCSTNSRVIHSIQALNEVVRMTMSFANMTVQGGVLDVKTLKALIHDLPDDMPVMIEASQHSGRKGYIIEWERIELSKSDYDSMKENPSPHTVFIEKDGHYFMRSMIDYDHAFHARVSTDEAGLKAFCIHSSY